MSLFNQNTGAYQNLDASEQIVINSTENQILFSGNQDVTMNVNTDTQRTITVPDTAGDVEFVLSSNGILENIVLAGEVTGLTNNTVVSNAMTSNINNAIVRRDSEGNINVSDIVCLELLSDNITDVNGTCTINNCWVTGALVGNCSGYSNNTYNVASKTSSQVEISVNLTENSTSSNDVNSIIRRDNTTGGFNAGDVNCLKFTSSVITDNGSTCHVSTIMSAPSVVCENLLKIEDGSNNDAMLMSSLGLIIYKGDNVTPAITLGRSSNLFYTPT